ncbi:MAG: glycosyltransferase family 4 protein [Methanobacterium sp.]|jgi:glycosyltransferase involved in cell wall biosynthesis
MNKRILLSIAYFYPHIGGYENYIYELYSRINHEFDTDVLVFDCHQNESFESYNGFQIYRMESWGLFGGVYPVPKITLNNLKIINNILKNDYLFVNTHTRFFLSSFLGLMIAKLKNTILIHTEHGSGNVIFLNTFVSLISKIYDFTLGKLIIKSANVNIGISKASCEFLKIMGAKNTYLINNGIDINLFVKKETNLKEELGIPQNYRIITFIGRLIYSKGVQDLIKVFKELKKDHSNTKLIIVGDGNYRKELEIIANDDKNIMFLGNRNDIPDILSITDVFVNPSYSEGLPTSILEAISVGVPIVATNVGGTKEIFSNEMGYLIDKNNEMLLESIVKIIESDFNHIDHSVGKKYIEKYSWDKIATKFLDVIEIIQDKAYKPVKK